ncbi:MAG: flagellar filament capping protein FliD, partial [Chloroflexi bacterium]|nr:flagellar filament capping protein FliD [Chloroflexota bacterium]
PVGNNAVYRLNGEAVDRYSTSNTVTDAVTGVTLNFKKADDATWITLNVNQDTSSTVAAVKDFVSQYNSAMSLIRDKTAYDATKKEGGLLMGDATVLGIERTMASLLNGSGVGLSSVARSLSDIGITTGKVGTAVGQTDNLVLDESKLVAKLQSNAAAVADVFGGLVNTTALTPGGTGSIASVAGTPNKRSSGSYSIVSDASGNLTATFTPSGGGAPVVTTGTILAGGTNSTLIPGVTLTAKGVPAAGTDTVTTNFTTVGVGVSIADYLSNLTKSGGIFDVAQESGNSEIADINSSIQRLQDRLDQREANLRMKFNALELALSNLQNQSSSLSAQLAQLSS